MDDRRKQAHRAQFDGKIKLRFHGAKMMCDNRSLAFRKLDEAFHLTERGIIFSSEPRHKKNTQHTMMAVLR